MDLYEEQIIPPGSLVMLDENIEYEAWDSMATKRVSSQAGLFGMVLACVKHGHRSLPKTSICLVLARDGNHWLLMDKSDIAVECNSSASMLE